MRHRQLAQPSCDVRFWDFALPVAFGSMAGLGAGFVAGKLMAHERTSTRAAFAAVSHAAAFWLFGGLTWVLYTRRPH